MRSPKLIGLALLAATAAVFVSGADPYWSDWGQEAALPVTAAMEGDLERFLDSRNGYIASLLLRLPVFLVLAELGGGETDAFWASAALAMLAVACLSAWLLSRARAEGAGGRLLVLIAFLTAGNPLAASVLEHGHPEDILAATGMITGVLLAARQRPMAAGVILGLAIVCKQWAVLAVLPAVAAAPVRRPRLLVIAAAIPAIFMIPLLLAGGGFASTQQDVATSVGGIWRSHQIFWPLGVADVADIGPGPMIAPALLGGLPRILIVGASIPLTLLWYRRLRNGVAASDDVVLLVALLLLLRCVLDPWNISYYHLPFVLALVVWEVLRRPGPPVLSLLATAAVLVSFEIWPWPYGDATYVMYMAWTLPLAYVLVRTLLTGELRAPAFLRRPVRATPSAA